MTKNQVAPAPPTVTSTPTGTPPLIITVTPATITSSVLPVTPSAQPAITPSSPVEFSHHPFHKRATSYVAISFAGANQHLRHYSNTNFGTLTLLEFNKEKLKIQNILGKVTVEVTSDQQTILLAVKATIGNLTHTTAKVNQQMQDALQKILNPAASAENKVTNTRRFCLCC